MDVRDLIRGLTGDFAEVLYSSERESLLALNDGCADRRLGALHTLYFFWEINRESSQYLIRRLRWERVEKVRQQIVCYLGDYYRETKEASVCEALLAITHSQNDSANIRMAARRALDLAEVPVEQTVEELQEQILQWRKLLNEESNHDR